MIVLAVDLVAQHTAVCDSLAGSKSESSQGSGSEHIENLKREQRRCSSFLFTLPFLYACEESSNYSVLPGNLTGCFSEADRANLFYFTGACQVAKRYHSTGQVRCPERFSSTARLRCRSHQQRVRSAANLHLTPRRKIAGGGYGYMRSKREMPSRSSSTFQQLARNLALEFEKWNFQRSAVMMSMLQGWVA